MVQFQRIHQKTGSVYAVTGPTQVCRVKFTWSWFWWRPWWLDNIINRSATIVLLTSVSCPSAWWAWLGMTSFK